MNPLGVATLLLFVSPTASPDSGGTVAQADLTVVHPDRASIGEWIDVEIAGPLPEGTENVEPALSISPGPFEVLQSRPGRAGKGELRWKLRVTSFEPGVHTLGPLRLRCRTHDGREVMLAGEAVRIEVVEPVVSEDAELRPPLPPVSVPWGVREIAVVVAAIALVAATTRVGLRRLRPSVSRAPVQTKRGARDRALEGLTRIERRIPVTPGSEAGLFEAVAGVFRTFLGDCGVPALFMTSGEIIVATRAFQDPVVREAVTELLRASDQVRFGGVAPDEADQRRSLRLARAAVDAWRPEAGKGSE